MTDTFPSVVINKYVHSVRHVTDKAAFALRETTTKSRQKVLLCPNNLANHDGV